MPAQGLQTLITINCRAIRYVRRPIRQARAWRDYARVAPPRTAARRALQRHRPV